jgi:hypothetical protein
MAQWHNASDDVPCDKQWHNGTNHHPPLHPMSPPLVLVKAAVFRDITHPFMKRNNKPGPSEANL